jgi:hypothetical protein
MLVWSSDFCRPRVLDDPASGAGYQSDGGFAILPGRILGGPRRAGVRGVRSLRGAFGLVLFLPSLCSWPQGQAAGVSRRAASERVRMPRQVVGGHVAVADWASRESRLRSR